MRRSAATVLTCAAALAAVPSPASAATATQAISELNAQRAANGLPAGITENPTWSNDCALHDRYMAENGGLSTSEDPNNPGYSPGGAFAAQNAVLIDGAGWDSGNPY